MKMSMPRSHTGAAERDVEPNVRGAGLDQGTAAATSGTEEAETAETADAAESQDRTMSCSSARFVQATKTSPM